MNYELENRVTHLEAENEGLRKLVQGKNELLKKALEENQQIAFQNLHAEGGTVRMMETLTFRARETNSAS